MLVSGSFTGHDHNDCNNQSKVTISTPCLQPEFSPVPRKTAKTKNPNLYIQCIICGIRRENVEIGPNLQQRRILLKKSLVPGSDLHHLQNLKNELLK